jgi:hypothetical protein
MPLVAAAFGDFVRAESTDDQYRTTFDPPRDVEEQVDARGIGPVQVVEDQDERLLCCEAPQYAGVLMQNLGLVSVRGRVLHVRLDELRADTCEQRSTGHEYPDDVGTAFDQRVARQKRRSRPAFSGVMLPSARP